ncbi:hypothetical protein C9414_19485, partial [Bacillus sp. Nf3]
RARIDRRITRELRHEPWLWKSIGIFRIDLALCLDLRWEHRLAAGLEGQPPAERQRAVDREHQIGTQRHQRGAHHQDDHQPAVADRWIRRERDDPVQRVVIAAFRALLHVAADQCPLLENVIVVMPEVSDGEGLLYLPIAIEQMAPKVT